MPTAHLNPSQREPLFTIACQRRRPTPCIVASASTNPRREWQIAREVQTRITIAASTGRLDISDCGLKELPPEVFNLEDLVDLSCSGNQITHLPDKFDRLCNLKRLGLSGNELEELPASIGSLQQLEGLWVHGNLLRTLPEQIGELRQLKRLALAGNRLTTLPETLSGLINLQILSVAGNEIKELPTNMGALKSLRILAVFGNLLSSVPENLTNLSTLEELWLQSNFLEDLPSDLSGLHSLKQLSLADNLLEALPESFGNLPSLEVVWLYNNKISELPSLTNLKKLSHAWLENNPLKAEGLRNLLPLVPHVKTIGLTAHRELSFDNAPNVVTSYTAGTGAALKCGGYFKLQAHSEKINQAEKADVLVVAFGSAPGVPNWGGLLKKVKVSMRQRSILPVFDILYVVDSARSWYTHDYSPQNVNGGKRIGSYYRNEVKEAVKDYKNVIMLGDSMGASGALMFSHLATSVLAFCPQVDLTRSSIRPGKDQQWLNAFTEELLSAVSSSSANIAVHCGSWSHDLEQASLLPSSKVNVVKHGVDDHRLAKELEARGQLLTIVQSEIETALGVTTQDTPVKAKIWYT
ncbi:unnamed protein product [Calypogeia fissa]